MSGLRVIKPGSQSLIQDNGRHGYQSQGLTSGGALDELAANWANKLLDNPINAPLLEITLGNVELIAEQDCRLALTGAELTATSGERAIIPWSSWVIRSGERLKLGWARKGMRAYLAVEGGFQLTAEFGSCSTVVRERLGGLDGAALKKGALLPCNPMSAEHKLNRSVPFNHIPDYDQSLILRVITGYQFEQFTPKAQQQFFTSHYIIQPESDRMGFRLKGDALSEVPQGLSSEGIAFASIQVPPDGQPIILLKDRQTLGGYPKLGCLHPLDAFLLSQRRAGTEVKFELISLVQAQNEIRDFNQFFSSSA